MYGPYTPLPPWPYDTSQVKQKSFVEQMNELEEAKEFIKFKMEKEKKHGSDVNKKPTFWGLTTREMFWYMFALSPAIGIPVALLYLNVIKLMVSTLAGPIGVK